jgi:nucleoside diphosphate kinase
MLHLESLQALAAKHYAEHEGKPFFPKLVNFLSSGPVVAMVWEGKQVGEKDCRTRRLHRHCNTMQHSHV